ncbi:MAG: hypothetical protein CL608_34325 [Anaerolineaceae bacterium]|jgi:Holliday junction resolvase RusA-like endonuclease|nr:hypothetical protein [Anaerolineaceae bacterium]
MTTLSLQLNVDPVPASRPRFVRRGNYTSTYYAGRYKEFLQETGVIALENALGPFDWGDGLPFTGDVEVEAVFNVKRPKTTKLTSPKGDVDNYGKALLDLLQPTVIQDDKQVTKLTLTKQFTDRQPCITLTIQTLSS